MNLFVIEAWTAWEVVDRHNCTVGYNHPNRRIDCLFVVVESRPDFADNFVGVSAGSVEID